MRGGLTQPLVVVIAACRGRSNENGKYCQRLELNLEGGTNTITTVQKDNYVLETKCIDPQGRLKKKCKPNDICPTLRAQTHGNLPEVIRVKQATKKGYIECENGGVADLSYPSSAPSRGRVQENGTICPTITAQNNELYKIEVLNQTSDSNGVLIEIDGIRYEIDLRKLTPKECFRLMGFSDEEFERAEAVNSNSQLYKQAGNSIVVDVLYYIYKELYKAMPYLFDDIKLLSLFSGIGAFESGLDRLYNDINSENSERESAQNSNKTKRGNA